PSLQSFALPSVNPGFSVSLPAGANLDLVVDGNFAYVRAATSIVPVNVTAGTAMPAIPMVGSTGEWVVAAGKLYTLVSTPGGPAINGVNLATRTALFATPVALPFSGPAAFLR